MKIFIKDFLIFPKNEILFYKLIDNKKVRDDYNNGNNDWKMLHLLKKVGYPKWSLITLIGY